MKPKIKSITLQVLAWTDDPMCPKCRRVDDPDETAYNAFHLCHIENTDLLLLTCRLCGFNWFMETGDAKP